MSAVRQDTVRLQAENSQLHIRLIQEAEKYDRQEKSHYQQVKKLEDRIAELSYWKQSASEKLMAADRENSGLRRKIDGLVKLNDKLTSGRSPLTTHCNRITPRECPALIYVGSMDPQAIAPKISSPHGVGEWYSMLMLGI